MPPPYHEVPVPMYGFGTGKFHYTPRHPTGEDEDTRCVHGEAAFCGACTVFNKDILTPAFDPTSQIVDAYDARKYHEEHRYPTDCIQYFLEVCANLNIEDPQERDTPKRMAQAIKELTTPDTSWEFTTFDTTSDEMVVVADIRFASLCRHHVLPYTGVAHVAYIPNGKLAGLSKIPRYVLQCAASLSTQEELTTEIADGLEEKLTPLGVAVAMEAEHTCMSIRGVQATGTRTYTAAMRGVFADHDKTAKQEFLSRINGR